MALGRTSPRDLPLFADLSGRDIRDIFRAGEEVSVPAGWSLILEQTPPDAAYLILSGTAAVREKGEEIAELGPGDIAGEVAVRKNTLRTATVTAKSRLQLLHFTREKFDDLTRRLPAFRDAIDATEQRPLELPGQSGQIRCPRVSGHRGARRWWRRWRPGRRAAGG